jgi:hypothetical protein
MRRPAQLAYSGGTLAAARERLLLVVAWALLALVLMAGLASAARAETKTFVGPGSEWSKAGNWSPEGVPTLSDDVVINSVAAKVTGSDAVARSISIDTGLPGGGTLQIADHSLTTSSAGTSAIDGFLQVAGTLNLNDPTSYPGSSNSGGINIGGTLNIGSTFAMSGAGENAKVNELGTIHVLKAGTLVRETSAGSLRIEPKVDNDGKASVLTGTLKLGGGDAGSTAGEYAVSEGATLAVAGSFGAPAITGAGTLDLEGASMTVAEGDAFSLRTLQVDGNSSLTLEAPVSLARLVGVSGRRKGNAQLTVTEAADLSGLALEAGTTTIASSIGSLAIERFLSVAPGATLDLQAPTSYPGSSDSNGINIGGTLNIASTFTTSGAGIAGQINEGGTIHVLKGGSLIRNTSSETQSIGPKIENDGSISLQTGTMQVSGGLTQTSGSLQVLAGARLAGGVELEGGSLGGAGTLGGPVTNSGGIVSPGDSPGVLTIEGEYSQTAAGTLEVDIQGTIAGTSYDQLAIGGAASLAGTLAIVTPAGFEPAPGDEFTVLTTIGARSGEFATLTGADVGSAALGARYGEHAVLLAASAVAPMNRALPSIPASAVTGTTVTCEPGTWTGSPTFAYEWRRDGSAIAGASAQRYTIAEGDAGHTLVCHVTATNAGGSSGADSNPLVPTRPAPAPAPAPIPPAPLEATPPRPVAITQIATLPSPKACVSRRHFIIHLLRVKKAGIVTAAIELNGRTIKTVRRSGLGLPIDLRGLPKGTFTISIVTTDAHGHRLIGTRRFHTCVPGKHGKQGHR